MSVLKKASKSFSKGFKSITKSPFNAVSSLAKGDFAGALNSVAEIATLGTISFDGDQAKVKESASDELASAAESTAKKRKSLYFTEGEELGQDTTKVFNTSRRGSIFS